MHIQILPSSVNYLYFFFGCLNLVWLHPAFPMGTDEEESLVSSGAGAAADVCRCCMWLLGPCRDSPFKRASAEYLSAVAFWGGRDQWARSLNILGTRPPACRCGLGSPWVRPSTPSPKLEAQREPTFNQSVFVYAGRFHF